MVSDRLSSIERSLKKDHREFIDDFSSFLELSNKYTEIVLDTSLVPRVSKYIDDKAISTASEEKTLSDEIMKLLDKIIKLDIKRVDYSDISNAVIKYERDYSDNVAPDALDNFFQSIRSELLVIINLYNEKKDYFEKLSDEELKKYEDAIVCFYKSIEHAVLANLQFKNLYLETQELLDNTEKRVNDFRLDFSGWKDTISGVIDDTTKGIFSETNKLDRKLKNLEEDSKKVYTDFIAILGVFSSFVFVMFGGFSALSDIIASLNETDIYVPKIIFISSILFGFLITVLYSLLYWISLIINKPIFNNYCDCEQVCTKYKHIFIKHRYYLMVIITCLVVSIISIVLAYFK